MPADAEESGTPWVDTRSGPVDPTQPLDRGGVPAGFPAPKGPPAFPTFDSGSAGPPPFPELFTDPTPTGELPIITGDTETTVGADGRTPARRRLVWAAAIAAPVVLFFVGISLIVAGLGLDWGSGGSSSSSNGPTNTGTLGLPVATAATVVPIAGDPAVAATDVAATFTALLQAGRFEDAAAMTGGVYGESAIEGTYQPLGAFQTAVVRIAPVGPDEYRVRLAVFAVPADASKPATARCEQWSVNPAAGRVIPGKGVVQIRDAEVLALRGAELTTTLTGRCATAPMP